MPRFILRFTGKGAIPASDVARWRSHPNCHIVDQTSRMLLVDAEEKDLLYFVHEKQGEWQLTPERITAQVPDPRPRVKKRPPSKP